MQKEGSKLCEGGGILKGQRRGSLQTLKAEITVSFLQNLGCITPLQRELPLPLLSCGAANRSLCFPVCSNKPGMISWTGLCRGWYEAACGDSKQHISLGIKHKSIIFNYNWCLGTHILQRNSMRRNHVNRVWCRSINGPAAAGESMEWCDRKNDHEGVPGPVWNITVSVAAKCFWPGKLFKDGSRLRLSSF